MYYIKTPKHPTMNINKLTQVHQFIPPVVFADYSYKSLGFTQPKCALNLHQKKIKH